MRRFTIPKAWLDRIIIAGKTCSSSEAGAKGVFIASSRGGLYAPGTPQQSNDFQEIYLRAILAASSASRIRPVNGRRPTRCVIAWF